MAPTPLLCREELAADGHDHSTKEGNYHRLSFLTSEHEARPLQRLLRFSEHTTLKSLATENIPCWFLCCALFGQRALQIEQTLPLSLVFRAYVRCRSTRSEFSLCQRNCKLLLARSHTIKPGSATSSVSPRNVRDKSFDNCLQIR